MQGSSRLWVRQNRLWVKNATVAALVSTLLLALAIKVVPDLVSSWPLTASPERPALAEMIDELAIEQTRNKLLLARLDSLKLAKDLSRSSQTVLTAIRQRCDCRQVTLVGYDRILSNQRTGDQILSYRLLIQGRFHAIARLLADLEALPHGLTVQSFTLESRTLNSELIQGVFVISTGVN